MLKRLTRLPVVVVLGACSGAPTGGPPSPQGPTTTPPSAPSAPRPHAGECYWAGHLTATVAPMRGDATCVQSRPLELDLKHEELGRRSAPGTELGLVIEVTPASAGVTADGVSVNVMGELTLCTNRITFSYALDAKRSVFGSVDVTQDMSTRRITGQGTVTMFCSDDTCRCEAGLSLDGTIEPSP